MFLIFKGQIKDISQSAEILGRDAERETKRPSFEGLFLPAYQRFDLSLWGPSFLTIGRASLTVRFLPPISEP